MYCRKCGKYIGTDADFCDECLNAQLDSSNTSETKPEILAPAQQTNNPTSTSISDNNSNANRSKNGLGMSIALIILGFFSFIFMAVTESSAALMIEFFDETTNIGTEIAKFFVSNAVVLIIGIATTIFTILFGVKTLKSYVAQKKNNDKPVITVLILSIIGVIFAGFAVLLFLTLITDFCMLFFLI